MMRLALVLAVLALATPAEAACHHYSVWHYAQPQRCGVRPLPVKVKVDPPPKSPTESDLRAQAVAQLKQQLDALAMRP